MPDAPKLGLISTLEEVLLDEERGELGDRPSRRAVAALLAHEHPAIRQLRKVIELMLCEIEGIDVGFENGCKGAAIMVGKKALGLDA